jgi:hypothetical protein
MKNVREDAWELLFELHRKDPRAAMRIVLGINISKDDLAYLNNFEFERKDDLKFLDFLNMFYNFWKRKLKYQDLLELEESGKSPGSENAAWFIERLVKGGAPVRDPELIMIIDMFDIKTEG